MQATLSQHSSVRTYPKSYAEEPRCGWWEGFDWCTDAFGFDGEDPPPDPPPDLDGAPGTADFTAGTCVPLEFNDTLIVTISTAENGQVMVELEQPSTGDLNRGIMQLQTDGTWTFFAEREGGGENYGGRFTQSADGRWSFSAVNNYNDCTWEVIWVQA